MWTLSRRPMNWVGATLCFLFCLGNAFHVLAGCGCYFCATSGSCMLTASDDAEVVDDGVPFADFRVADRWRTTATDGRTGDFRGQPRTLTWGLVRDGTTITGAREGTSPSNLISWLDGQYGGGRGENFAQRPWFDLIASSFERWEELSGLTFNYESSDFGAAIDSTTSPAGSLGRYADHRVGGHRIDGNGNVLAYNYFPDHADMVIDTSDSFFNNRSNDSRRLRNMMMHEIGHGLGFAHLESNNSTQLMEPQLSTSIDGPQIDDILAVQRNYGDALEKNGGNDSASLATPVEFDVSRNGTVWSIGNHGTQRTVSRQHTDFVSIDGSSDQDFFAFSVDRPSTVDLTLRAVGRTYNEGPQGGDQSPLVTSMLNNLELEVATIVDTPREPGVLETIAEGVERGSTNELIRSLTVLPGRDYFARVFGTVDAVQLYQLSISVTALPIPEPGATGLALLAVAVSAAPRRRWLTRRAFG